MLVALSAPTALAHRVTFEYPQGESLHLISGEPGGIDVVVVLTPDETDAVCSGDSVDLEWSLADVPGGLTAGPEPSSISLPDDDCRETLRTQVRIVGLAQTFDAMTGELTLVTEQPTCPVCGRTEVRLPVLVDPPRAHNASTSNDEPGGQGAIPTPTSPTPTPTSSIGDDAAGEPPIELPQGGDMSTDAEPAPRTLLPRATWLGIAGVTMVAIVAGGAGLWRFARRPRPMAAPPASGSAHLLKKYVIGRQLGRGAFASVWLATHAGLGRQVVLKTLHPGWARDDAARARFRREARILALVDHPNVTRIFDMEEADDRLYLVMEHVEAGNLDERLRRGPLRRSEATRIVRDVLSGLAYVHARGVVHRDIKPTNVLLTERGEAKLADFGVSQAALASPDLAASGAGGTPL